MQGTRRLNLSEMAGSLRVFGSAKDASAVPLTEADEGSVALRAYATSTDAQLDGLRAGTDAILQLCVVRMFPPPTLVPTPPARPHSSSPPPTLPPSPPPQL